MVLFRAQLGCSAAGMILKVLTVARVKRPQRGMTCQQHESIIAVGEVRAGEYESETRPFRFALTQGNRQQSKRVVLNQISIVHAPRAKPMTGKGRRERCPVVTDVWQLPAQRFAYVRLQTVDVNMQLVL